MGLAIAGIAGLGIVMAGMAIAIFGAGLAIIESCSAFIMAMQPGSSGISMHWAAVGALLAIAIVAAEAGRVGTAVAASSVATTRILFMESLLKPALSRGAMDAMTLRICPQSQGVQIDVMRGFGNSFRRAGSLAKAELCLYALPRLGGV